jgi:agmatine/peptidylarginine deiminase
MRTECTWPWCDGGAADSVRPMDVATPRQDGFAMPAEFARHQATWMSWPTRGSLWVGHLDSARDAWAATARAVAAFEPVTMVCNPGESSDVRRRCGAAVEPLECPIDDSWLRDNGPIFVTNARGEVALVHFDFNSWGGKYLPCDLDARLPDALASHFGIRRYRARSVLEGGSFFVDGEGTLLTTEQCLMHPNRNPFDEPRRDRTGTAVIPRRRRRDLAAPWARRGSRHGRPCRRVGPVRSARRRDAVCRGRR